MCVAAVSALAKFGAQCDELLPSVVVLLERFVKHFLLSLLLLFSDEMSGAASDGTCHAVAVPLISQLPKLCVKISILMHRRMWVRSFSTRLTSVTFAEDKVLIFLILCKNAKIVQL